MVSGSSKVDNGQINASERDTVCREGAVEKGKGKSVSSDNEESCVQLAEGKRVVERRRELEKKERQERTLHLTFVTCLLILSFSSSSTFKETA